MSISKQMEAVLNAQINVEMYSAYLYLSMSSQAQEMKLSGLANWFYVQYQEEIAHAIGFLNYIINRGATVILTAIEAPPVKWDSAIAMFELTCEHELQVTERINTLMITATEIKDYATVEFLNWYIKEQVEEETVSQQLLSDFKLAQNAPGAILMLDRELKARVFTAPMIG